MALAAQRAAGHPVSIGSIRRAAKDWYLRDKEAAISANPQARKILRRLIDVVVGQRRSRTFLLNRSGDATDQSIQDLYDARLLHVLKHGVASRHNPGEQFDGFAIDYGCYVNLLLDDEDFQHNTSWYENWLAQKTDVAPDNFQAISRSIIELATLREEANADPVFSAREMPRTRQQPIT